MPIDQGPIEFCVRCPVGNGSNGPVFHRGAMDAPVVIIGEAPGRQEVDQGRPFVGPAGQLLDELLENAGFSQEELVYINPVLCRPPGKINVKPPKGVIEECRANAKYLVQRYPRQLVILCGDVAMSSAELETKGNITSLRGSTVYSQYYEQTCFLTMHPSAGLHTGRADILQLQEDLKSAKRLLSEEKKPTLIPEITDITAENIAECTERLLSAPKVAFDTETTPSYIPFCVGFAISPKETFYLPIWENRKSVVKTEEHKRAVLDLLRRFAQHPGLVIAHNATFDIGRLVEVFGAEWTAKYRDTMITAHLLDEERSTKLNKLACIMFHIEDWKQPIADFFGGDTEEAGEKRAVEDYSTIPSEMVRLYVCQDALATFMLDDILEPQMDDEMRRLRDEIDQPAAMVFEGMGRAGMLVDRDLLDETEAYLETKKGELLKQLQETAGKIKVTKTVKGEKQEALVEFNPNSTPQVAAWLYGHKGLPVLEYTPHNNPSVNANDVLVPLFKKTKDPELELLLSYNTVATALGTFINGKKAGIKTQISKAGRIHPSFGVASTRTGRTSCWHPNMQQIPSGMGMLFIPDPGYVWVYADYSQAELRMLAVLSRDETLKEHLATGDIHRATASAAFSVPFDEVSNEQRQRAKTVNFGIIYQQHPKSLAQQLGISETEAEDLQQTILAPYEGVRRWFAETTHTARQAPHEIKGLFGRTRRLWHAIKYSEDDGARAIRQSINSPVQSGAADLMKLAVVKTDGWIRATGLNEEAEGKPKAWCALQIHDSQYVSALNSDGIPDRVAGAVESIMTVEIEGVQFVADVEIKDRMGPIDMDLLSVHKKLRE